MILEGFRGRMICYTSPACLREQMSANKGLDDVHETVGPRWKSNQPWRAMITNMRSTATVSIPKAHAAATEVEGRGEGGGEGWRFRRPRPLLSNVNVPAGLGGVQSAGSRRPCRWLPKRCGQARHYALSIGCN
jgi:hypothetical protein